MQGCFRITHPFHPRRGEELERIGYRRSFGGEVVDGRDATGALVTLPLAFTDAAGEAEPFLAISAGRAFFRADDLLRLAEIMAEMGP